MEGNEDHRARLAAEAERVRASGHLGRSDLLGRLFVFLLDRSLQGHSAREVEIAQDVFGKGADFDMVQDASVRVYVHRLRRKLEDFYGATPEHNDCIVIPKGEYRLTLATATALGGETEDGAPTADRGNIRRIRFAAIVVALLVALNLSGWVAYLAMRPADPAAAAAATPVWTPLSASTRPMIVVTGDYYMFAESPDTVQVSRLLREFAINSRNDLDDYLMQHPIDVGRYLDVDLHYLPVSVAPALRNLVPVVNMAAVKSGIRPQVVTMSQLAPDMLNNANIVYVGFLSGLGLLRDIVFDVSDFSVGSSYDQLIDKRTGRRFSSDWAVVESGKIPHVDYAYIASFRGPSDNQVLVIAGTRDAAVIQAGVIAADAQQLGELVKKAGTGSFEALYRVRTLGRLNIGSSLIVARPIGKGKAWHQSESVNRIFPDDKSSQDQTSGTTRP